MSKPATLSAKRRINKIISSNRTQKVRNLNPDGQVLFEFLTLLVDIHYRERYGTRLEVQRGRGYTKQLYNITD